MFLRNLFFHFKIAKRKNTNHLRDNSNMIWGDVFLHNCRKLLHSQITDVNRYFWGEHFAWGNIFCPPSVIKLLKKINTLKKSTDIEIPFLGTALLAMGAMLGPVGCERKPRVRVGAEPVRRGKCRWRKLQLEN